MYKYLIFDFDGTIANTHEIIIKNYDLIGKEFRLNLSDKQKIELRDLSAKDVIEKYNISYLKVTLKMKKLRKMLDDKLDFAQKDYIKFLENLKSKGYVLGIVSSNSQKKVDQFLKQEGCANLFDFKYAGFSLFSKHKKINKIIKEYGGKKEQFVYIGDEVRDYETAQNSNIDFIGVTWGMNTKKAFVDKGIDCLVGDLRGLEEILKK